MLNLFFKLRNLRKYFFLKIAAILAFLYVFFDSILFHIPLHPYINRFDYTEYMIDNLFLIYMVVVVSLVFSLIEIFFRFILERLILRRKPKPYKMHSNKYLSFIDNIYSVFFIIFLFIALFMFLQLILLFFGIDLYDKIKSAFLAFFNWNRTPIFLLWRIEIPAFYFGVYARYGKRFKDIF